MTEPASPVDAFNAGCATRELLNRLSGKWISLVLVTLEGGPMRVRDLYHRIDGISRKMLTQTVRTLERDGIITRTVAPTVPLRTDDEFTELGRTLLSLMAAVKGWAEANIGDVRRARKTYDGATPAAQTEQESA